MIYYIDTLIYDFLYELNGTATGSRMEKMFNVTNTENKMDKERKGIFHTYVMKVMFLMYKSPTRCNIWVRFLSSRVQDPNEGDWIKLITLFIKKNQR